MMNTTTNEYNTKSAALSQQNGHVVDLMVKGDYAACLLSAFRTLEEIRALVENPPTANEAAPNTAGGRKRALFLQSAPLTLLDEISTSASDESAVAFYNRALIMHMHWNPRYQGQDNESDVAAAAILMYNIGLCHHAQSFQVAERSRLLQKARCFYNLAMNLLARRLGDQGDEDDENMAMQDGGDEDDDALALVRLALMNNLAHIHAYFMDIECAVDCFEAIDEEMDSLPLTLKDDEEEDVADENGEGAQQQMCSPGGLTDEDFCFFSMASALSRRGKGCFVASPAA